MPGPSATPRPYPDLYPNSPAAPPAGYHREDDAKGLAWFVPNGHSLADYPGYGSTITPGVVPGQIASPNDPTTTTADPTLDPTRPLTGAGLANAQSGTQSAYLDQLPTPGQGEQSGPFAPATNHFLVSENQPFYQVRIWRAQPVLGNRAGGEWEVLSAGTTDTHRVGDFVTTVSTSHSMSDPAGQFSISLLPIRIQPANGGPLCTWAQLLKPMDYVEITLARTRRYLSAIDGGSTSDKEIRDLMLQQNTDVPFVVLRGFITNVRVVDAVDGNTGQPQRRVMVNGMNFHKLWLQYRMYLLQENMENYQTKYGNLFTAQGTNGFISPAEFMGILYGAIFRPQLALLAKTLPEVLRHGIYCDVPSGSNDYKLLPSMLVANPTMGPLDTVMRQYAVTPYTEFYTYDEPWPNGRPITTWRWSPYVDRANRFPLPSHILTKPTIRVLHDYEITEHDIGNSDNDVLTYYWAAMTQSFGIPSQTPKLQAPGYLDDAKLRLYGFRPFEPPWPWTNDRPTPDMAVATDPNIYAAIVNRLTGWLASVFEHNVDNMEGQVVCNGRPDIHIGEYLDVPEAGFRYYVEGVSHELIVGQGFTTTLNITRGLPMRDLPNWTLPPGHRFDTAAAGGQASLGGSIVGRNPDGSVSYATAGTVAQHFEAPQSSSGAPMTGELPPPDPTIPGSNTGQIVPGGPSGTKDGSGPR